MADVRTAPWTGPALLVPVTVQALVLTTAARNAAWSWVTPNYAGLSSFLPVEAPPFGSRAPSLPSGQTTGVVVRWSLPDGLTRGATTPGGAIAYPPVPNRWLVTRKAVDPSKPGAWAYQGWVVASDHLDRTPASGSPFPDPAAAGGVRIGTTWPLAAWPGEAAVGPECLRPPLTATGAADPTFAAFTPNVVDVFAMGDPLTGVPPGPVSYSVCGWYADPAADPLYGAAHGPDGWRTAAEWAALLADRRWSVGDDSDLEDALLAAAAWAGAHGHAVDPARPHTARPARTLCHGVCLEVEWLGPSAKYVTGVPPREPTRAGYVRPRIAVAATAADGVAALLADAEVEAGMAPDDVTALVEILEAFAEDALGVLDRADGQAQLAVARQASAFGSVAGGTAWTVVAPEGDQGAGGAAPHLTPEQAELLTALNRAQHGLDGCAHDLRSRQWDAFALWWKEQRLVHWGVPPPADLDRWLGAVRAAAPPAMAAALAQVGRYRWLRQQRDDAAVALAATIRGLELRAVPRPPFRVPADPVLMVTGARRAFTAGEDGRFSADGTLRCRFTGQTVAGLSLPVGGRTVTVAASQVPLPAWDHPDLPAEAHDLLAEAFLIDLSDAPVVASVADPADPWPLLAAVRDRQVRAFDPDAEPHPDGTGAVTMYGHGALPSKVGVELWSPPWAPLYLDWQVQWLPGSPDPATALAGWELPAAGDGGDPLADLAYRWKGGVPKGTGLTLSGRTFLTPGATDLLATRIRRLLEAHADEPVAQADLWALQDALGYVESADLLSQALGGFHHALLQRSPLLFRTPPAGPLDPVLAPGGAPALAADVAPAPSVPTAQWGPITGGHLRLQRLWVVDGFAQVFDVLAATGGQGPPALVLPRDMATAGDPTLAELKPRVAQPVRLSVDLLDAGDDGAVVGVATGADPVCGWLLANHLDRSFLVYDAAGCLQGELLLAAGGARWLPPADAAPPPSGGRPPVEIANRHLRAAVLGVLEAPDSAAALGELLEAVDDVAWAVDPSGGGADDELDVLVGRPLAVVRARMALEPAGPPATTQVWADTGHAGTGGFEHVAFPVQLGTTELLDDGLVGCWVDDDYGHLSSPVARAGRTYVRADRPRLACDATSTALVTLLMDPARAVHAVTGILPVVSVRLPASVASPNLARMEATFRTGPVLGDPSSVAMPLPALDDGAWTWLQYQGTAEPASPVPVAVARPAAALPDVPAVLREGWLALTLGGPPTVLTYTVEPPAVATARPPGPPAPATVQVVAWNGGGHDVACSAITLELPVGTGPGDLTADPARIEASVPAGSGWSVAADGAGTVTAKPVAPATGLPAGATLRIVLAAVPVGAAPGAAAIRVVEHTEATREAVVTVNKVAPVPGAGAGPGGGGT